MMPLYAIDVRDRVLRWLTQKCRGVDNTGFFLIAGGSAKQEWVKAGAASEPVGNAVLIVAATIIAPFVKSAPSHNNTRTTGFVTAAGP